MFPAVPIPALAAQWPLHVRMTRAHPRPAIYLGPVLLRDVDDLTRARAECEAGNRVLRRDYLKALREERRLSRNHTNPKP